MKPRAKVTTRKLLAAAAGSSMITMALCSSFACGNLVAPPQCNADGSSPQPGKFCVPRPDGGTGGGSATDGGDDGGIGGDR